MKYQAVDNVLGNKQYNDLLIDKWINDLTQIFLTYFSEKMMGFRVMGIFY